MVSDDYRGKQAWDPALFGKLSTACDAGDVLRVERTATGDVAFFRNGKPHGPGFTDADGNGCHGDVKLCVEMGEAGQQVQLQYDALYA